MSSTFITERLSKPARAGCVNGVRSAAPSKVAVEVSRTPLEGEFMIARVVCS